MAEVTLSAGIRSNLVSLQRTNVLLSRTQERLSTGKAVNSAIDSPKNFFAAANLEDRAAQLDARLDGMGQAVSTLQAADNALSAMRGIVSALNSVVYQALAQTDSTDRAASGTQFNELLVQLATLSKDAAYQGINLLKSGESDFLTGGTETLTVQFNEGFNESILNISGVNVTGTDNIALDTNNEISTASLMRGAPPSTASATLQSWAISFNAGGEIDGEAIGIRAAEITTASPGTALGADGTSHEISWIDNTNYRDNLKSVTEDIEAFDQALVNTAKSLSQNVNIVSLRQEFTTELINVLEEGADKLVLADLNEEGANLLALQTAQQLGSQSLAIASQANQSVLSLLG